jgi:DNA mismatch endonuclease (patch repair protein)
MAYWAKKVFLNRQRDRRNVKTLSKLGWETLTIWECEVGAQECLLALANAIRAFPDRKS